MDTCYLCGQPLFDKDEYNKDPSKFGAGTKFKHAEHIIQNALYGRLTSDEILCETCGTKLSDEVDSNFVKLFDGFTVPINHILASKDHGGKLNKTLLGHIVKHNGQKIEIQVRDGKITPRKPDFDYIEEKNHVKIYANSKTLKHYQTHVLGELKKLGVDISTLKIELIDDIQDFGEMGVNFSEGVENFNLKIKLGLNKIATGFAVSNGINRNELPCTLDTKAQQIIFTTNVVPFYPYGVLDLMIEPFRVVLEEEFPTHTLMLYTDNSFGKTKLVCFIDLFSTFQFYVILNHDYKGNTINKTYYQTIIKQTKPKIDVRRSRWKYLPLIADAMNVDKKEMAGMSIDEMYDFLETKYKQFNMSYTLDINAYVEKVASRVSMNLMLKNKISSHLGELEKEILDATPELDTDDMLCLYHELNRVENETPDLFYKKEFIVLGDDKTPLLHSTLMKMIELNNQGFDGFKSYGHSKFFLLCHFVHTNENKK